MRCTFCQVDISLLGSPQSAAQGSANRPPPPTKGALLRRKVLLPLCTGLFGILALPTALFLVRNDSTNEAVVIAIAASILSFLLYSTKRRFLACFLAWVVGAILVLKPIVHPVTYAGGVFSLNSETHYYFLIPGACLLAVFGWLFVEALAQRESKAEDSVALRIAAAVLFVIGMGVGHVAFGGPIVADVLRQYEPQGTAMRKQFFQLAKSLPQVGQVVPLEAKLVPPPVWIEGRFPESNIEIVMVEELWNPEQTEQSSPNLYLSGELMHCVRWTGPKNPLASSAMSERAGDFPARLAHAFGLPWLAAYRFGNSGTEIFVFDLRTGKIVATTVVTGTVGDFSKDRKFVLDQLARITGGTFTLR